MIALQALLVGNDLLQWELDILEVCCGQENVAQSDPAAEAADDGG